MGQDCTREKWSPHRRVFQNGRTFIVILPGTVGPGSAPLKLVRKNAVGAGMHS